MFEWLKKKKKNKSAVEVPEEPTVVAPPVNPVSEPAAATPHAESAVPTKSGTAAGGDDDAVDAFLPRFTVREATEFKKQLQAELRKHGVDVTMLDDHAKVSDGSSLGYGSIMDACADAGGPDTWAEPMEQYVAALMNVLNKSPEEQEEMFNRDLSEAICKLIPAARQESLDEEEFGYGPKLADEVPVVATLDSETFTSFLPRSVIEDQSTVQDVVQSALSNLASLIHDAELEHETSSIEGAQMTLVGGPSVYTSSFSLFLPLLVNRVEPDTDQSGGVLFVLHDTHSLSYHVCRTQKDTKTMVNKMALYARFTPEGGGERLSEHVFYYRDNQTSLLHCEVDEKTISVGATEHFMEGLSALPEE